MFTEPARLLIDVKCTGNMGNEFMEMVMVLTNEVTYMDLHSQYEIFIAGN